MNEVIEAIRDILKEGGYRCWTPNVTHPYEIWTKRISRDDKDIEVRLEMRDSKNCPTVECEIFFTSPGYSISFIRLTQFCAVLGKTVNVKLTVSLFFTCVQRWVDEALKTPVEKKPRLEGVHQTIHPILYPNPIRKTLTLERVSSKWKLNRKSERLDPKIPLNTLVKNRRKFSWSIYLEETQEESEAIKQLKQACVKQLDEDLEKDARRWTNRKNSWNSCKGGMK